MKIGKGPTIILPVLEGARCAVERGSSKFVALGIPFTIVRVDVREFWVQRDGKDAGIRVRKDGHRTIAEVV